MLRRDNSEKMARNGAEKLTCIGPRGDVLLRVFGAFPGLHLLLLPSGGLLDYLLVLAGHSGNKCWWRAVGSKTVQSRGQRKRRKRRVSREPNELIFSRQAGMGWREKEKAQK